MLNALCVGFRLNAFWLEFILNAFGVGVLIGLCCGCCKGSEELLPPIWKAELPPPIWKALPLLPIEFDCCPCWPPIWKALPGCDELRLPTAEPPMVISSGP